MGEIGAEVEAATRALEAMIGAQLAAGTNRCVLAATCIWGGVKEMSEVTSSESAAAALRTIADQIEPPAVLRPAESQRWSGGQLVARALPDRRTA